MKRLRIGGLRIWLLDGESQPHNVLPMNEYGDLPRLEEVQLFVAAPWPLAQPAESRSSKRDPVPAGLESSVHDSTCDVR